MEKVVVQPHLALKIDLYSTPSFLDQNNIFEKFPSGFRTLNSLESALIKVTNDVLLLLLLSRAFYTV